MPAPPGDPRGSDPAQIASTSGETGPLPLPPAVAQPAAVDLRPPTTAGAAGFSAPAPAIAAAAPVPLPTDVPTRNTYRINPMELSMTQANKAAETMFKAAEEAAEFGRGNVEAFTRATQIYVAGVQDLGRQTFAVMQGLTDQAIEGAKALSSVKSLQEAAQIQSSLARAAMEKSVAESAKIGEQALKLAEQAFAPLNARFTLAGEKFVRTQAAA
ncbi:MAG: phasin family protein [Roseomonas sp.]|nr:phasin family protein [Roseomonas sp.]MBX9698502.1 phasin family protein [Acetobacteraceae bacterium]